MDDADAKPVRPNRCLNELLGAGPDDDVHAERVGEVLRAPAVDRLASLDVEHRTRQYDAVRVLAAE